MKPDTKLGIDDYVTKRIPPGGFLLAVLSNDLAESLGRADDENARDMLDIVSYVWNFVPARAWGSREKVAEWLGARHE